MQQVILLLCPFPMLPQIYKLAWYARASAVAVCALTCGTMGPEGEPSSVSVPQESLAERISGDAATHEPKQPNTSKLRKLP